MHIEIIINFSAIQKRKLTDRKKKTPRKSMIDFNNEVAVKSLFIIVSHIG